MDKKKGLSAFLNKNKKQGKKAADASPEKEEQADVAAAVSQIKLDDKPEVQKTTKVVKKKSQDESSSEEEEDMRIGTYGKVLEQTESTAAQDDEEKSKAPTDFADLDKEVNPKADKKKAPAKNTGGAISFGSGRPTFGNRAKVSTITKDDGGLEDLLDDEAPKGKKAQKAEKIVSQIVRNPVKEEVKGPVRPTFKGKLKLNAGADTAESGTVQHAYDFGSKYKTDADEEEKEHGKKQKKPQSFNIGGGGKGFAAAEQAMKQEHSEFDDDGFQVTGAGEGRQARRQQAQQYRQSQPDDGFRIVRNAAGEGQRKGGAFDAMK